MILLLLVNRSLEGLLIELWNVMVVIGEACVMSFLFMFEMLLMGFEVI